MKRVLNLRSLLITLVLGAVLFLFVVAFSQSEDERVPQLPKEVVRVFPADGDVNLRQDRIGIQLAQGYTGTLRLDRVEIPADQLQPITGFAGFSYTPGDEALGTPSLSEGRHCATARFWRATEAPETGIEYTWCFTAA